MSGMEKQQVANSRLRRGLYALADSHVSTARGLDVVECMRAMMGGGVSAVQLRAKDWGAGKYLDVARELRAHCPEETWFMINDRTDVASLCGARGVHVGQEDMTPVAVKQHYPQLECGLSTHNLLQLKQGLLEPPAYLALGPIFATSSKKNPEPEVGLTSLREAYKICREQGVSLVAIGGITSAHLEEGGEGSLLTNTDLVAAISLLLPEVGTSSPYSYIEVKCRQLQSLIASPGDAPSPP